MSGTNDFVVKFATVNGSGSASADAMFVPSEWQSAVATVEINP